MHRIFISHNSKNSEEVKRFTDFLVLGMNIPRDEIFSSSRSDSLQTGENFADEIKEALKSAEKVICFITSNYLQSKFCMAELGAAWVQEGKIIPLLLPPVDYADLRDTPLIGVQMRRCDSKEDLTAVYDELCNSEIIRTRNTNEFNISVNKYIRTIQRTPVIEMGQDGYYTVTISEVRSNMRKEYRCYKIHGLLKLDGIETDPNETHWIFYRTGMYRDLKVGDAAKIKVSKTESKYFPDIKKARNIYPDDLRLI